MLIDAHVHLDRYDNLLAEALREIESQNIFTVATAMDVPSYLRLEPIAERSELVLAIFGVHPRRAPEYCQRLSEISRWIDMSPAIGEIGLDFHWVDETSQYPAQLKVVEYFLAAAREQKKFVNLHTKGAEREILDLLERYDIERAIIHWYSGPLDILRNLIQFGAYFTIGVEVTFSDAIKTIAQTIPDHLLLTETDNPGGLKWLNGTIGMPGAIRGVVHAVADVRGVSAAGIERLVQENFTRLISNDPHMKNARRVFAEIPQTPN
jgi:TatD DNase family protein